MKTRNKKYRPRPIAVVGGLHAIQRQIDAANLRRPLSSERQIDLQFAYLTSIEAMVCGRATVYHADTLIYALNVGQILAERGLGQEYLSLIEPAIEAMQRARARYLAHGKFGLDGPGLVAISAVADLHAEQMRLATHAELMSAVEEMHKRVASNPQQRGII